MKHCYKKICYFLIVFTALLGFSNVQAATCKNHVYTKFIRTTVSPTCTRQGKAVYQCGKKGCTKTYVKTLPKTNTHNYTTFVKTIKSATCVTTGTAQYRCSNYNCTKTTTKTVQKSSHDYSKRLNVITESTCKKAGTARYQCSRCSAITTKSMPKKTHNYTQLVKTLKAATCKSNGSGKYQCATCTDTTQKTISKTDHVYDYNNPYQQIKAATCIKEGSVRYKCKTCTKTTTASTPKVAHSYTIKDKVVRPATCTSLGVTSFKCSTKGCTSTLDKKVDKANHDFDLSTPYKIIKESTCTTPGQAKYKCKHCSALETNSISTKGHEFTQLLQVVKEATCTNKGVWRYKCTNCNQTKDESVNKIKHNYTKMIEIKAEATCTTNGIRIYKCTNCDSTTEKTDGKLGHKYILKAKNQNEHHKVCERCNDTIGVEKHTLINGKCVCGYPKYEPYSDEYNKALQEHMKEKGYYNSTIDGDMGTGTRNAILRILRENGFEVDLPSDFGWDDITTEMYYIIMNHTDKAKNLKSHGFTASETDNWAQNLMYYGNETLEMQDGKFVNPEIINPKYVIIYLHGDCVGGSIGTHPLGGSYSFSYDTLLICPFSYTTSPFVNQTKVETLIMNVATAYPNAIIVLEGHSSSTATVRNIAKDSNSEAAKHIDGYALYSPVTDVSGLNSEENCYVAYGKYEIDVSENKKGTFYNNDNKNNVTVTGRDGNSPFAIDHGSAPQFFGSQSHAEWLETIAENTDK